MFARRPCPSCGSHSVGAIVPVTKRHSFRSNVASERSDTWTEFLTVCGKCGKERRLLALPRPTAPRRESQSQRRKRYQAKRQHQAAPGDPQ